MTRPFVPAMAALLLALLLAPACRTTRPAATPESSAPAATPASSAPAATPESPAPAATQASFERLHALVGRWQCTTPSARTVELAYRLVSGGSALVETFTTASGKETMTIFHLDGPHLLATHYCAQGNQPRLRLQRASDQAFDFAFHDATNLAGPDASHLDRLALELIDADHHRRTEIYAAGGEDETTRFECQRVP
jgi:hypothetical protein